jgi:hypothetical protein
MDMQASEALDELWTHDGRRPRVDHPATARTYESCNHATVSRPHRAEGTRRDQTALAFTTPQRPNAPLFEHSSLAVEPCTFTRQYWFGLGVLEALECGMLVRSGEDPSTTSSSANWERTDNDMDRLEAASAAKSRPECVPEDADCIPVARRNPWYVRAMPAPPGTT